MEAGVLPRVLQKLQLWTRFAEDDKRFPEARNMPRALTPEQEQKLSTLASSRPESKVVFPVTLFTAKTTAGGVELRNVPIGQIDIEANRKAVAALGHVTIGELEDQR